VSPRRVNPDLRVVVIVGASSGIGRAAAARFAERGAQLVLASRSAATLEQVAQECRAAGASSVRVVPTDVLDEPAVERLIHSTRADLGRIDVVVHTAQVMAYGRIEDVPPAVYRTVVDTALVGTANVARHVLPVFRQQDDGVLILVNSLLGSVPVPQMGAYITAKWGQLGLARVLQLETRDAPGVHVCVVAPGAVDTPIYSQAANYMGGDGRPPPPVDPPERIADAIVRTADRPRSTRQVGLANYVVIAGFRLLPKLYNVLVGPLFALAGRSGERAPTDGNVFEPQPEGESTHGRWHGGPVTRLR
jgi:NAD(P)-dependent dehydrogenase (short-subunit alcohol dehydrogenase family)